MIDVQKKFRIGQKVRLNSGSPDLTVVDMGDRITVEWSCDAGKERCPFPSVCLTAV